MNPSMNYQAIYLELLPAFTAPVIKSTLSELQSTQQLQMQSALRNDEPSFELAARNLLVNHRFCIALVEAFRDAKIDLEFIQLANISNFMIFGGDHNFLGMLVCALEGDAEYDTSRAEEIVNAHGKVDVKKIANGQSDYIDTILWLYNMGAYNAKYLTGTTIVDLAVEKGWDQEAVEMVAQLVEPVQQ